VGHPIPVDVTNIHTYHPLDVINTSHPLDVTDTGHPLDVTNAGHPLDVTDAGHPLDVTNTSHPLDVTNTGHPQWMTGISPPADNVIQRGVFGGSSFLGFHGMVIRKSGFLPPENPRKICLPDFWKFWARGFLGSKTWEAMVQALSNSFFFLLPSTPCGLFFFFQVISLSSST
jgi:hypothetical protein